MITVIPTGGTPDITTTIVEDGGGGQHTIGVLFWGSDGYASIHNGGYHIYKGEDRKLVDSRKPEGDTTYAHFDNFLQAMKSRNHEDLNCDIEVGHVSAALCHLANISYRVNDKVRFKPVTERFIGNDEANRLLTRDYRAPFVVPEKV